MESLCKTTANRRNAKLGGVKTKRGKSIVRHNARKHGILSGLKTKYEGNAYDSYLRQLQDEYDPQSFMESLLIERIAVCCLMLQRAVKAEREFMRSKLEPRIVIPFEIGSLDKVVQEGYEPTIQHEDIEKLSGTYLRYQTTIENRLYKAIHELERLQRLRSGENVPSPVAVDFTHEVGFVSQK